MHIAWTHVAAQYPDEMPAGQLSNLRGRHRLRGRHSEAGRTAAGPRQPDLPFRCTLECQNFRPPDERELTFSAYGHQGTDVCGIDLRTNKVVNYSDAPDQYDEPEGIFPDGKWTCVECDRDKFGRQGRRLCRHLETVARWHADAGND